jgi:hypothetical protein
MPEQPASEEVADSASDRSFAPTVFEIVEVVLKYYFMTSASDP